MKRDEKLNQAFEYFKQSYKCKMGGLQTVTLPSGQTKEIWIKASPKYKGLLLGNMYYSTLKDIIIFGILKKYIPYRKYQKN
jgi:hypothetical protein